MCQPGQRQPAPPVDAAWFGAGRRNGVCGLTAIIRCRCAGATPTARTAAAGFSPLDQTLDLLTHTPLTPQLLAGLVRLGTALPFEQAATLLAHFRGVWISPETVRRWTEAAGTVQGAVETQALEEVLVRLPPPPAAPALQQFSADGVLVGLVGGAWNEVKTLVLGSVTSEAGEVRLREPSYVARLSDATTFGWQVTLETHRRGTLGAGTVVAVQDGAEWLQGLVDLQCPEAVRILDFPHALGHLGQVAQAVFGVGRAPASEWLGVQAHTLRHGDPAVVLADLADLAGALRCGVQTACQPDADGVIEGCLLYLSRRREQIEYRQFAAQGYPIGSGSVESANKVLVEARLKGSGMRWARENVNPLLVLRCLERNQRWDEAWPSIWRGLRERQRHQRADRRSVHPHPPPRPPDPLPPPPGPAAPARPKMIVNGKPTAAHPWRRSSPFRAKL